MGHLPPNARGLNVRPKIDYAVLLRLLIYLLLQARFSWIGYVIRMTNDPKQIFYRQLTVARRACKTTQNGIDDNLHTSEVRTPAKGTEHLTRNAWIYASCANINFLCQGLRKLSSDRHTYSQTDTTKITHHVAQRVVSKCSFINSLNCTLSTTISHTRLLYQENIAMCTAVVTC